MTSVYLTNLSQCLPLRLKKEEEEGGCDKCLSNKPLPVSAFKAQEGGGEAVTSVYLTNLSQCLPLRLKKEEEEGGCDKCLSNKPLPVSAFKAQEGGGGL